MLAHFLGLSRITSAAVASAIFAGGHFLVGSAPEKASKYLEEKGYLPQKDITQTTTELAIYIIIESFWLWDGMLCASATLALASFSIEPFSPLAAFASTVASTAIIYAAINLKDSLFPEN